MTPKILVASLIALVAATTATAQSDKVTLHNGTVVKDIKVISFDVRNLRLRRRGSTESIASDQIAKVELAKFERVYARGMREPGIMLTMAREQLAAKNMVMAQLGFIGAAKTFFDYSSPSEAVSALNELRTVMPEAGLVPEVHRMKFEYYLGTGPKGAGNALKVAKKYESDAIGGAWPSGFSVEAKFLIAISTPATPPEYQTKLRGIISQARATNPVISHRANVELAHSLRKTDQVDEAKRIYDNIVKRTNVDQNSRAGAYLGLGQIMYNTGDKAKAREALLMFLRVRLETRDAWPSLQAEALYSSMQAARKWGGPESNYIRSRCRRMLLNEFPNSEWAKQAKN
jgi:tetratricopeptide (TPR) repeat protein